MAKKIRSEKELKGMIINVNEEKKALVKFVSTDVFIDTDVTVADDYALPKIAGTDENGKACFFPTYYACKLNVTFAKDVKNVTVGSKEEKEAKNAEILKNATGFKAVCRDITALAGKEAKGFLKITASLPCDKAVNPNGSISNLWLFSSKELRQDFLDMVQNGINNGKYHLEAKKSGSKKELKKVKDIALAMDITYEEAYAICVKKGIVKEK